MIEYSIFIICQHKNIDYSHSHRMLIFIQRKTAKIAMHMDFSYTISSRIRMSHSSRRWHDNIRITNRKFVPFEQFFSSLSRVLVIVSCIIPFLHEIKNY